MRASGHAHAPHEDHEVHEDHKDVNRTFLVIFVTA